MTKNEMQLWEKRIRLAAAERRYRLACQSPSITFPELEIMLCDIERLRDEAGAADQKVTVLNYVW